MKTTISSSSASPKYRLI